MDATLYAVIHDAISQKLQTSLLNVLYKQKKRHNYFDLRVIVNGLACDCGVYMFLFITEDYLAKLLFHKTWVALYSVVVYMVCII